MNGGAVLQCFVNTYSTGQWEEETVSEKPGGLPGQGQVV